MIGLLILTPVGYASTYEAWTSGVYDAECDETTLVVISSQVVDSTILATACGRPTRLVEVLSLGDDPARDLVVASARSARAPPAA